MSRFDKVSIVAGGCVAALAALVISTLSKASDYRFMKSGGGAMFTMAGMAALGLAIVAAAMMFVIVREPRD